MLSSTPASRPAVHSPAQSRASAGRAPIRARAEPGSLSGSSAERIACVSPDQELCADGMAAAVAKGRAVTSRNSSRNASGASRSGASPSSSPVRVHAVAPRSAALRGAVQEKSGSAARAARHVAMQPPRSARKPGASAPTDPLRSARNAPARQDRPRRQLRYATALTQAPRHSFRQRAAPKDRRCHAAPG